MRKAFVLALLAFVLAVTVEAGEAKKWRIALSNDYAGNSWRQTMIRDWEAAAQEAKDRGLIAEAPAFTINENSAAEQAAQIQNLILEGYDAIVIQAGSPTALNAAIREGLEAGIVMVCFENATTEKSAWNIVPSYVGMGESEVDFIAQHFKEGNLLEVRGIPGTTVDGDIHQGILNALKKYPGLKIVSEVYGQWTQTITQREVAGIIPSLPDDIVAVVTQGGDGYGTVKAFEAAGRKVPMVIMGNRYDELKIWKELRDASGYKTMSISGAPGVSTIAFWATLEILNGTDVPKHMDIRIPSIYEDMLDHYLSVTPEGGVVTIRYPQKWVQELIKSTKEGTPAPADPK